MKKILIIEASPRKRGNSDLLTDELIRGASENGCLTEKVYLRDLKIRPCMACYACRANGKCVIKNDAESVLEKMMDSDVIVLASPVYFYSMSAQLKTLIDRTLPVYTRIKNKDFYFIITAAAKKEMMERTADAMRGFTDCLPRSDVKAVIYGEGVYQKGEVLGTEASRKAYRCGKEIR